jgi:hypothetical protein
METESAWKKYDEAALEELEGLARDYIDFISECEKLGDYVMNVVQAGKGLNNGNGENSRNRVG